LRFPKSRCVAGPATRSAKAKAMAQAPHTRAKMNTASVAGSVATVYSRARAERIRPPANSTSICRFELRSQFNIGRSSQITRGAILNRCEHIVAFIKRFRKAGTNFFVPHVSQARRKLYWKNGTSRG